MTFFTPKPKTRVVDNSDQNENEVEKGSKAIELRESEKETKTIELYENKERKTKEESDIIGGLRIKTKEESDIIGGLRIKTKEESNIMGGLRIKTKEESSIMGGLRIKTKEEMKKNIKMNMKKNIKMNIKEEIKIDNIWEKEVSILEDSKKRYGIKEESDEEVKEKMRRLKEMIFEGEEMKYKNIILMTKSIPSKILYSKERLESFIRGEYEYDEFMDIGGKTSQKIYNYVKEKMKGINIQYHILGFEEHEHIREHNERIKIEKGETLIYLFGHCHYFKSTQEIEPRRCVSKEIIEKIQTPEIMTDDIMLEDNSTKIYYITAEKIAEEINKVIKRSESKETVLMSYNCFSAHKFIPSLINKIEKDIIIMASLIGVKRNFNKEKYNQFEKSSVVFYKRKGEKKYYKV